MVKRKKRLIKGIESLKKQIEIHKEKLKQAKEDGNEDLANYYEGEIESKIKIKENKEKILEKN